VDQPLGSRYVLHELLGRGAMGQVYRGSVRQSGAQVAVKVLKPELVSDPEVVARFFQERAILTSISHPHVVRVTDLVVEGETLGIVMELVQGADLRRFLRERGTLPPGQAIGLVCQLLDGLAAVHAAGIVHRDVKPENVLTDTAGGQPMIRLTDFGVSRLSYGGSLTKLSTLIGTPEYMAPEVAEHDTATPAADLYSAGIVLYELLAGRTPFAGGHPLAVLRRHADHLPPPIPGLPAALWAQLQSLLAKDPAARPPSAVQAAMALSALAGSVAGIPALPAMADPAPGTWSQVGAAASAAVPAGAATGPGGGTRQGTVLRRRDRGTGNAAPAGTALPASPAKRRARPVVIALPAAVVVLAAAIGVVVLRSQQQTAPPGQVAAASYAFAPQRLSNGLLAARQWTLGGRNGSVLTETVTLSSASHQPVRAVYQDAIPKAIAPSVRTVTFTPEPARIVQADPVVEWDVLVPAHRPVVVGYHARVPAAGASRARLVRWASALDALQPRVSPGAVTIQLKSLRLTPRTLRLAPGAASQFTLSGVLASGQPAPPAVLAGAAWTSGSKAVAIAGLGGQVTAIGPGSTYVTVQVGSQEAAAAVIVSGTRPNVAAGGVRPGVPTVPPVSSTGTGSGGGAGTSGGSGGNGSTGGSGGGSSTPPAPVPVNAYSNYGPANAGHAMCRGNPASSVSMPGGTATQTFTVPGGVASLSGALVQIDPDATVTAHLTVYVNGAPRASVTAAASGDTRFSFGPVGVQPGQTVTIAISFTATYGKIITVYTAGAPGGTFTASNSCPDGAPSLSTTSTGLRAVVSGMS
jgi:serine/threonine-protein kinase